MHILSSQDFYLHQLVDDWDLNDVEEDDHSFYFIPDIKEDVLEDEINPDNY